MNVWRPVELALSYGARLAWPAFQAVNRQFDSTTIPAEMGARAADEEQRAHQAAVRLAADDRLALPHLRARGASADSGGRAVDRVAGQRARRRDQGAHPRARRQGHHREDLPACTARSPTRWRSTRPSSERLEDLFPGRDFDAVTDRLHNHGTSSIKHGRGAVLTIDLTNRCNMMCDPCFMDANQVGYVHELTLDEVKQLLDDAVSDQAAAADDGAVLGRRADDLADLPRRRALRARGRLLQRPGGNQRHPLRAGPGLRPRRRARPACASPTCSSTASAKRRTRIARSATCSTSSCAPSRHLHAAGIDVCLVVTIVNTVNNDQVGPIIKFALENCDKVSFVSFQPVSFTGRDEDISDADRHARRYTLSHLAEDVKRQTGVTEPLRDWFPLSASSVLSDVTDLLKGPGADWGTLKCGCHPDCGIGTAFMVSKKTREWAPLASFINVDRFLQDARVIADSARGPFLTKAPDRRSACCATTRRAARREASGSSTCCTSTTSRAAVSSAASSAHGTTPTASRTSGC